MWSKLGSNLPPMKKKEIKKELKGMDVDGFVEFMAIGPIRFYSPLTVTVT